VIFGNVEGRKVTLFSPSRNRSQGHILFGHGCANRPGPNRIPTGEHGDARDAFGQFQPHLSRCNTISVSPSAHARNSGPSNRRLYSRTSLEWARKSMCKTVRLLESPVRWTRASYVRAVDFPMPGSPNRMSALTRQIVQRHGRPMAAERNLSRRVCEQAVIRQEVQRVGAAGFEPTTPNSPDLPNVWAGVSGNAQQMGALAAMQHNK
jgi:hypothetical protein